jgi:hypothetical protein
MTRKHTRIYLENGIEHIDVPYDENSDGSHSPYILGKVEVSNFPDSSQTTNESNITIVEATLTRPADSIPYIAGDLISGSVTASSPITLSNIVNSNGGRGYITKVILTSDDQNLNAEFRLWLYNIPNPGLPGDNEPYSIFWDDAPSRLGYVDLPLLSTENAGSGSDCGISIRSGQFPFNTLEDSKNLYGVLQTKTAFEPVDEQQFYLKIFAEIA